MADKIVVITGASGGIGAATAELLAGQGMSVALVARRQDALEAVAARCGARAHALVADGRATLRRRVEPATVPHSPTREEATR